MTGPQGHFVGRYQGMSKQDIIDDAKAIDDDYQRRKPEHAKVMKRWFDGEITGDEAQALIDELDARGVL